jgi:peptidoglycan-associated lipoprotein
MDIRFSRFAMLFGAAALGLAVGGCAPKAVVKPPEAKPPEQAPKPVEEPSLRGKEYQEVPELQMVYFDLDQATLRLDARATLQKNYGALKQHADWEVLVEGHCDERGTTEYNLALGQRRASAVRGYYMNLGIDGSRIATISYGKEKPLCGEHNEDCWSKNRRAVTKVRISASATPSSGTPPATTPAAQ